MYVTIRAPNFSLSLDLCFSALASSVSLPDNLRLHESSSYQPSVKELNTILFHSYLQIPWAPLCHFWFLNPSKFTFIPSIILLEPISACSRAQQHIFSKRWGTEPPHIHIQALSSPPRLPAKPLVEFCPEQFGLGYGTKSQWFWLSED